MPLTTPFPNRATSVSPFSGRYWSVGVPIRNISDYSPFGVALDGRTVSLDNYRYGFQNQEEDAETGLVNYKYRMHDPRVGRFFAVDPLASKYPWNSVYAFSENRIIDGRELEGLEYFYSSDGTFLGKFGTSTEVRLVNSIDIESAKEIATQATYHRSEYNRIKKNLENKVYTKGIDLAKKKMYNHGVEATKSLNQLINNSEVVGGLIIQNRIEEGSDYTISEFTTVGGEQNIQGFILEPAGPSTSTVNQDKRIPEGIYNVEDYSSPKFPDNFRIYNDVVPKSRKIL